MEEKRDLEDVMREEKSRGRRPIDTEELRVRQRLLKDLRRLLRVDKKQDFVNAMRVLGLEPGSPLFEDALRIWRDVRKF